MTPELKNNQNHHFQMSFMIEKPGVDLPKEYSEVSHSVQLPGLRRLVPLQCRSTQEKCMNPTDHRKQHHLFASEHLKVPFAYSDSSARRAEAELMNPNRKEGENFLGAPF